ncbi:MAG: FtsX-like permease family protein [Elusimicrobia bacterium]|nr:FtsX-like permease family protein [Elusimicrobiota bacterium]
MYIFKLAYKNLIGAGLRTWLNVFVLSLAYVLIILHQGILSGFLKQGTLESIKDEIAGGQYWQKNYDPYDSMTLDISHEKVAPEIQKLIDTKEAAALLMAQGTIYPSGRVQSVLLKGIDPNQTILGIDFRPLETKGEIIPVMVGMHMAQSNNFKDGDSITIRWRDVYGTFDAAEGKIAGIFHTLAPAMDNKILWLPLEKLQKRMSMKDEATMVIVGQKVTGQSDKTDWNFKTQKFLLFDLITLIKTKRIAAMVLYVLLLLLALLAIFDTQVLSIFHRRKEIGTLMALGMARPSVIFLFTLEGAMNGILAMAVGAIYGTPLLIIFARSGLTIPGASIGYGFTIAQKVLPSYSFGLILGTVLIVFTAVTIVSFLPMRRISEMKPTEALKGKIQ